MASIRKTSTRTGLDSPSIDNTAGRTVTIDIDANMNVRAITRTTGVTTITSGRDVVRAIGG
jgi:hypothetical protein